MLCFSFEVDILGFLRRSATAMGCFFGCFRVKDYNRAPTHLVAEAVSSKSREPVESRRCLSALLLSEENDCPTPNHKEYRVSGSAQRDLDDRDLKDEIKYLKACGTLLETPIEIRQASAKDISPSSGDSELSKFHSWFPKTSIRKLNMPEGPDEHPTPTKLCEQWIKEPASSDHTPSSCICNEQGSAGASLSSNGGSKAMTPKVPPFKNKSVHFECDSDVKSSSVKSSASSTIHSQNSKESEPSKLSPYPTPLKLSAEMQTPGTVFPAYLEDMANAKNIRIRSQYVNSVMNPVENFSQWKTIKEEDYDSQQTTVGGLKDDNETVESSSAEKELKVEESLSAWLKPVNRNQQFSYTENNNSSGRTPGDRPILGMVAAHWNEDDEPSRISPKWWDGNGIPNSTNKYKEDQKVSWHATPFEERLEKALSEDSFVSQRKHNNVTTAIRFDENEEEGDTAQSLQQQHLKSSVVSF